MCVVSAVGATAVVRIWYMVFAYVSAELLFGVSGSRAVCFVFDDCLLQALLLYRACGAGLFRVFGWFSGACVPVAGVVTAARRVVVPVCVKICHVFGSKNRGTT